MSIPYDSFPAYDVWESDSTASGWGLSSWRASDSVLGGIDALVKHYNDPNYHDVRIETLFYLIGATGFWLAKLNKTPANRGEARDAITGHGLPTTKKVEGSDQRRSAMSALKLIAGELLMAQTHSDTAAAAIASLEPVLGKTSHGVGSAALAGSDLNQIQKVLAVGEVAIFLQQAHLQRRYKLRFRNGAAWRWDPDAGDNAVYDTTDNRESESNDRKTHFVMNTRGHIFAGFNKQAFWFKHSSLIGGANAYSAGRMIVEAGKVTHIENDSGHYHPGIQQMRNLLQRLRLYGRSIDAIAVRRIQPGPVATFTGAQIVASKASWPDGVAG